MGSPPTTRCPRCGTENASTMRFCGNCGVDMYPQAPGVPPAASPSRGFPVWGIVAIIGGVVAVAAVVTILLVTRGSEPAVTTAPPPDQTAGEQQGSTAVDQLTAYLPPEVTNCVDVNDGASPTEGLAEMACNPTSGEAVVVGFTLYESPEAARSAYDEDLAAEGVAVDSGDCSLDTEAEHGWSGGGGQGRIRCGLDDIEQAEVTWTSDAFPIVGRIYITTGGDYTGPELYAIWQGISDYTVQG
jgi:hypothetical protein